MGLRLPKREARAINSIYPGDDLQITMLRSKLHGACVTQCDLHYEGSVSIDKDLIDEAGMLVHERVDIWNVTNGARISTYVIEAPRGSRTIGINGAAARLFQREDRVIIASFAGLTWEEALEHRPVVVILADDNSVQKVNR
jgi:aspartate 1-decarboxylase